MAFTFSKDEKLKSKKAFEKLFSEGKSFSQYPLRIVYREVKAEHHKIAISVPKKNFKHAVDRNLYKRRIREAYRLNKSILLDQPKKYELILIFLSKKNVSFVEIETAVKGILTKLASDSLVND